MSPHSLAVTSTNVFSFFVLFLTSLIKFIAFIDSCNNFEDDLEGFGIFTIEDYKDIYDNLKLIQKEIEIL